ncbi:concanavalin A-like lectin/glucanase domain-containing protein [Elsinoe ampelina]|uniref:Crh-like protein n=1 Tax=Elsinoe ampelina TaxID=302913 RepID=A0A6A6GLH9_9PEZI|nr:concanavalin A-like lectin/glucanase domain-containing protein [Elsinoe ampelina]
MQFTIAALAALAALPTTFGQTFTDCNPLEKTCPADSGLQSSSFETDFTQGKAQGWTLAAGTTLNYGSQGAEFTIAKQGQAPTIESDFHILFGTLEVKMQAAPGVGIVSSIVLESADLDEIDWEFIGGDTARAQSNYFGKGNTTSYDRVGYLPVVPPPQTSVHTYTLTWTPSQLVYSIDGVQMRVLNAADANGGNNYPQTPMKVKLGSWAGGAPDSPAGTAEWAGGRTDYSAGPFTMYVQSVKITNLYPAKEYVWTDRSGSWQSIQVVGGSSPVNQAASSSNSNSNGNSGNSNGNNNNNNSGSTSAAAPASTTDKKTDEAKTETPKTTEIASPVQKAAATTTDASSTKSESASKTKTDEQTTHTDKANATASETHSKNGTSSFTTTTRTSEATPAVRNGNTTTTGSGTRSGSATSSTVSPARQTGGASSNSAMTGLILIFTLSMCMLML